MDKRYQVFVSSTYADLRDERSRIIQALMEMDCIPAGMELFPAADEEQFEFIKRVIDDCDYYLLLIGGRYGSTDGEGVSYTEKEYDYAIQNGLRVVAFLHETPGEIVVSKTDQNPERAQRLNQFREKAKQSRLVKFWKSAEELPGLVALSLTKTIKAYPAVGWVRGGTSTSLQILEELNALRKENDELKRKLAISSSLEPVEVVANLAGLEASYKFRGSVPIHGTRLSEEVSASFKFGEVFAAIAPHLLNRPSDSMVRLAAESFFKAHFQRNPSFKLSDSDFQTLKIQFKALGLISLSHSKNAQGSTTLIWSLTDAGERALIELRAVRS